MTDFKSKLLKKGFEVAKRDIEKTNALTSVGITEKYSNRAQLKQTLKELLEEVEVIAKEKKKIEFINKELSQSLLLSEIEVEKVFETYLSLKSNLDLKKESRKKLTTDIKSKAERKIELEKEIKLFKTEIDTIAQQLIVKKKEIQEISSSLITVEKEHSEKELSSNELRSDFINLECSFVEQSNLLNIKKDELDKLKDEFSRSSKRKQELETRLADMANELAETREEITNLSCKVTSTLEDIEHADLIFMNQEQELSKLVVEKEKLSSKVVELEENLFHMNELISNSFSKRKEIENELLLLDEEKRTLDEEFQNSKKELNKLKARESINKELISEEKKNLEASHRLLVEKKNELGSIKEDLSKYLKIIETQKIEKDNAKENINTLEKEIYNTKKEVRIVTEKLKRDELLLSSQVDEHSFKNERLQKENKYLESVNRSVEKLQEKLHLQNESIVSLDKEIQSQEEAIRLNKKERSLLIERVKESHDEKRDLEEKLSDLEIDLKNERIVSGNVQQDLQKVEELTFELKREIKNKESTILSTKSSIEEMKKHHLDIQSIIDELQFEIEEKESVLSVVESQHSKESCKSEHLSNEKEKNERILNLKNKAIENVLSSIERIQNNNRKLKVESNDLQLKTKLSLEKLNGERVFLSTLKDQKEQESEKLQGLNRRKRGLVRRISETSKMINDIHEEIDTFKKLYNKEDLALEELEVEYSRLQTTLVHSRKNAEDVEREVMRCNIRKVELQNSVEELENKIVKESKNIPSTDEGELVSLKREVESLSEDLQCIRKVYDEEISKKKSIFNQVDLLKKKKENILESLSNIKTDLEAVRTSNFEKSKEMISLSEEVYFIKESLNTKKKEDLKKTRSLIRRPMRDA